MGFTGKNITTAIMDDGVDYTHPDLMNNFVKTLNHDSLLKLNYLLENNNLKNAPASYDFSSNDPFPYPRYTDDWFNR